jgi:hypothetical protein
MGKLMYNVTKGWFNMVKNKRMLAKFERQSVKKDEFMVHEIDHIVKYAKAINRV